MKKLLYIVILSSFLFGANYTINLSGAESYENISFDLNLTQDDEGKPVAYQNFDIRSEGKIKSIKFLTAPGLKGTLADEREMVVYYKTSLNISGLKIRNIYKVGHARVYGNETSIPISFDKDHYQNITSFLRYHNIKSETIKDIDNMYGTWEEIELESKK